MKCVPAVVYVRETITVARKMIISIGIVAQMGHVVVCEMIVIGKTMTRFTPSSMHRNIPLLDLNYIHRNLCRFQGEKKNQIAKVFSEVS